MYVERLHVREIFNKYELIGVKFVFAIVVRTFLLLSRGDRGVVVRNIVYR